MRTSASQFEVMVDYMQKHGDLSKPTDGPNGRIVNINRWAELASALNADGTGNQKTAEKWRKVWSDMKNNTKRKAARAHRGAVGKDGGPAQKTVLNELELRVLNIIGPQAATGIVGVMEVGLNQDNPLNEELSVPQPTVVIEQGEIELSSAVQTPTQVWSQPSTSSTVTWLDPEAIVHPASPTQPTTPPLPPPPPPSTSQHDTPRRRRLTARRTNRYNSRSPRSSRPATQSELARIQFSNAHTEWRRFEIQKESQDNQIEREETPTERNRAAATSKVAGLVCSIYIYHE